MLNKYGVIVSFDTEVYNMLAAFCLKLVLIDNFVRFTDIHHRVLLTAFSTSLHLVV